MVVGALELGFLRFSFSVKMSVFYLKSFSANFCAIAFDAFKLASYYRQA
jgi:hypothetical protein